MVGYLSRIIMAILRAVCSGTAATGAAGIGPPCPYYGLGLPGLSSPCCTGFLSHVLVAAPPSIHVYYYANDVETTPGNPSYVTVHGDAIRPPGDGTLPWRPE